MKIIIFGTGSTAGEVIKSIDKGVDIIAVADNKRENWGKWWNGYKIIKPTEILKLQYDYILICSMFTNEIIVSLLERGIKRQEIIPYFNISDWQQQVKNENEIRMKIFKKHKDGKIALLSRRNSGCNCLALYKNIPAFVSEKFSVELIDLDEYRSRWKDFEVVFTTHMESRNYKSYTNIETWHGFPVKGLGSQVKNTDNLGNVNHGIDYIISYSNLYSYIMSSVYSIDIDKFVTTGMPRNDFFKGSKGRECIANIINRNIINKKIIYYVPTFRSRLGVDYVEGTEFAAYKQELKKIDQYMSSIRGYFLIKKHPFDASLTLDDDYDNIFFLEDDNYIDLGIDFYETLEGSDILITDYSSIYFDYLLMDKPIIFWTHDQKIYNEKRGFLFEDVNVMMPGPNTKTVTELLKSIDYFINNNNWYSSERSKIRKLTHAYEDYNSSARVWSMLLNTYRRQES